MILVRKPRANLGRCRNLIVGMFSVFVCATMYNNAVNTLYLMTERSPEMFTNTSTVNVTEHTTERLRDVLSSPISMDENERDDGALQERFPECIMIGVKKGGTAAIIAYLNLHPHINAYGGETHFFNIDSNYRRGLEFYRHQIPKAYPYQMTIEKTPKYWISELAPERIYKFNKTIKLIVTLRHPVKRMISDYWHLMRTEKAQRELYGNRTFEELAIDNRTGDIDMAYEPLNVSLYYLHLTRWLEYFPREQIHIVDGDNLIVNPFEEVEKIETFLGVEHSLTKDKFYYDQSKGFYCMLKSDTSKPRCLSSLKGHRYPDIDPAVYGKLMDFFKPLNEQLFDLLKRRFDWD